jgi:hypothetical protein
MITFPLPPLREIIISLDKFKTALSPIQSVDAREGRFAGIGLGACPGTTHLPRSGVVPCAVGLGHICVDSEYSPRSMCQGPPSHKVLPLVLPARN